jgi:cell wall-associated NlpC family hydrolase
MAWFFHYLGKPWQAYATGPDAFDCWGLVQHCLKTHYSIDVDRYINVTTDNHKAINQAAINEIASQRWQQVNEPQEGCVVLLSVNKCIHHMGLYTNGGVLHARDGADVCFETIDTLKQLGFKRIEYWQWVHS